MRATNQIVSFEHPDWKFGFDADPAPGDRHCARNCSTSAAADKVKLLGFHWQYPGVGFSEKKDFRLGVRCWLKPDVVW